MIKDLNHTLCFIRRGGEILMLNRENSSWMGSWNGVGGRLEEGETPEKCVLREVYEETGINIEDARDCGIVTWEAGGEYLGGMYVFLAEVPAEYDYQTPRATQEGILDWKRLDWVLHPENTGVIKNIQRFLPLMLESRKRRRYHCVYERYELLDFKSEKI